jgi:hypothetical protein
VRRIIGYKRDEVIEHCIMKASIIRTLHRNGRNGNSEVPVYFLKPKKGYTSKKGKVVPLHAMKALGRRGGIAPTHS